MLLKYLIAGQMLVASPYVLSSDLLTIDIDDTIFTFTKIAAGKFEMGDYQGQIDELPVHTVTIDSFYMQVSEVTIKQYSSLQNVSGEIEDNGCWYFDSGWKYSEKLNWKNPGYQQDEQHPVVCVSWIDVQRFIKQLNSLSNHQFRLPSESEWEYATRANSTTRYYWGPDPEELCRHANASDLQTLKRFPSFVSNKCDDGYLETAPVKSFIANPNGLFDVYGNVWEWAQDCWNDSYLNAPNDAAPWQSGNCSRRVFRGGGWGEIGRAHV